MHIFYGPTANAHSFGFCYDWKYKNADYKLLFQQVLQDPTDQSEIFRRC